MVWIGISLLALSLGVANWRGTGRIRRSGLYGRGQLVAQTVLIWAVPGSVFAVLSVMNEDRPGPDADPTARNPDSPNSFASSAGSARGHAP